MKQTTFLCIVAAVLIFTGCGETVRQTTAVNDNASITEATPRDAASSTTPRDAASSSNHRDAIKFGDQFPEVVAVDATRTQNGNWRFNVTLSSAYDTPERYADAWRVLDDQDNELGIRPLGHDHQNEQPFTRSQTIQIPAETKKVFVEGRDQENGWSGQRFEFEL